MKQATQLVILSVLSFLTAGCYYDNEERLYPQIDSNSNCDTDNVTLSQSVKPVFASRCYSCHANNTAGSFGSGINLETYAELKTWADNGKLEGAVKHLPGYAAMPQGAGKLDDCSINKITAWINKGALNN